MEQKKATNSPAHIQKRERTQFKDWHKNNLVELLEVAKRYFPNELKKILDMYDSIKRGD